MLYKARSFHCYFGNARDNIYKEVHCNPGNAPLMANAQFQSVTKILGLKELIFLNQTHSTDGFIVDAYYPAFDWDGDFLITDKSSIGIGVITADCVPIILYDLKNHAAAIVHAGWKGTVNSICAKVLYAMDYYYATNPADLQVIIGPSAGVCCYEVQPAFIDACPISLPEMVLCERDKRWYFDVVGLNLMQLYEAGIPKEAVTRDYNACTICDERFFLIGAKACRPVGK